jgi:thiol-disulfide isomerase/thioredoxin
MGRWLATLAVVSHGVVVWFHGAAHKDLGVGLAQWEHVFVDVVILAAPVAALVLVWTPLVRWGYLVLALSMAGALVFGVYHHYMAVSPDHVAHLPAGDAQAMFKLTAAILIVTEAFGTAVGAWGFFGKGVKCQAGLGCLIVLCFSLTQVPLVHSAEPASNGTPAEQYAALVNEFDRQPSAPEDFYPRFLALAEKYREDPISIEALAWVANHPGNKSKDEATVRRPFDLLLRDHLDSDKLPIAFDNADDDFLRTVMEKSPHRDVRGMAAFALAEHQIWRIRRVRRFRADNPNWQISKLWLLAVPTMKYYVTMNFDEAAKEVEKILQQVVDDYADLPIADRRNGKTIGELAKNHLHELRDLGIGMQMPELSCSDLDGRPVQLSDFKGKVVVLDVWATWFGPCRLMIPHEREMVNRLAEKPFVLVSISVDETPKTVRDFLTTEPMPWIHWFNGPAGNVIADLNVYSYPTIYVLDSKGVIRFKDIRDKQLDDAVSSLLKEQEGAK